MAGTKNQYWEDELLGYLRGDTGLFTGTTVYIALWTATLSDTSTTATPGESGYGTTPPAGNDGRKAITFDAIEAGSSRRIKNSAEIAWTDWAAGETVTDFAIMSAITGGNMLYQGTLTDSRAIGAGETGSFAAAAITIDED